MYNIIWKIVFYCTCKYKIGPYFIMIIFLKQLPTYNFDILCWKVCLDIIIIWLWILEDRKKNETGCNKRKTGKIWKRNLKENTSKKLELKSEFTKRKTGANLSCSCHFKEQPKIKWNKNERLFKKRSERKKNKARREEKTRKNFLNATTCFQAREREKSTEGWNGWPSEPDGTRWQEQGKWLVQSFDNFRLLGVVCNPACLAECLVY